MAQFKITMADPGEGRLPPGNAFYVILNGMDISSSVQDCLIHLDAAAAWPVIKLTMLVRSLEIDGPMQPEIYATLFEQWKGDGEPPEVSLELKDGGALRLVKGIA